MGGPSQHWNLHEGIPQIINIYGASTPPQHVHAYVLRRWCTPPSSAGVPVGRLQVHLGLQVELGLQVQLGLQVERRLQVQLGLQVELRLQMQLPLQVLPL